MSNSLNLTLGLRYASVENDLSDTGTFAIYPNGQTADDDVTVGELGFSWQADNNWRLLLRADQNYRFAKVDEYMSPAFGPTFEPVILHTQKVCHWNPDSNGRPVGTRGSCSSISSTLIMKSPSTR